MMTSLPSLFLSHGAPDLPLRDHPARGFLTKLSKHLPKPKGILIVSAHWEEPTFTIGTHPSPATVHDFSGFPSELHKLQYPGHTDAQLIDSVITLMENQNIPVQTDNTRGYDHGVWVPLHLAFPDCDIPVVQFSLLRQTSAKDHFALGVALASLRDEGILIIGSGSAVHNLRTMAPEGTPPPDWAKTFDNWLYSTLAERDKDAIMAFPEQPVNARMAHPTTEHFMPLLVAMGAGWNGGSNRRVHHSYSYGSLSMAAFAFGTDTEIAGFPAS